MICLNELIPTAHRYDPRDRVVTKSIVAGMAVMAASLCQPHVRRAKDAPARYARLLRRLEDLAVERRRRHVQRPDAHASQAVLEGLLRATGWRAASSCWMCGGVVCRGLPAGALAGLLGGGRDAAAARHGQEDQGQVSRRGPPNPAPSPLEHTTDPCPAPMLCTCRHLICAHWVLCKSAAS